VCSRINKRNSTSSRMAKEAPSPIRMYGTKSKFFWHGSSSSLWPCRDLSGWQSLDTLHLHRDGNSLEHGDSGNGDKAADLINPCKRWTAAAFWRPRWTWLEFSLHHGTEKDPVLDSSSVDRAPATHESDQNGLRRCKTCLWFLDGFGRRRLSTTRK
jgi:hypothetical protein